MFDNSPFVFTNEEEYRSHKKEKSIIQNKSVIKAVVVTIIVSAVLMEAGNALWKFRFETKRKRLEVEREIERDIWGSKTYDEKFVWMIKDMDKEDRIIEDVIIDDYDNAIYICIESGLTASEEVWAIRKDFQNKMSIVASNSNVNKKIYLVGVKQGVFMWVIGDDGEITDPHMLNNQKGDEEANV